MRLITRELSLCGAAQYPSGIFCTTSQLSFWGLTIVMPYPVSGRGCDRGEGVPSGPRAKLTTPWVESRRLRRFDASVRLLP